MKRRAGGRAPWSARLLLLLIVIVALGAIGFGIYAVRRAPPPTERGASTMPAQRAEQAGAAPSPAPAQPPN